MLEPVKGDRRQATGDGDNKVIGFDGEPDDCFTDFSFAYFHMQALRHGIYIPYRVHMY